MITIPIRITSRNVSKPLDCLMAQSEPGKRAAIEVKMRIDIPLPMPRSVMSSPIHMMRPVPAVIVITMSRIAYQAEFVMSAEHSGVPVEEGKSAPLRATVIRVVDCSTPSAMVR
jgi:hypothetical protein